MTKKLLTFLTLLTLFFGVGWAETMTFVPTAISEGNLTGAPNNDVQAIAVTSNGSTNQIQTNGYKKLTIKNMPSTYKVTGIKVRLTRSKNGKTGSITATMNNESIGSLSLTASDITQNSNSGSASDDKIVPITETSFNGDLVIQVNCANASYYVWQFEITYAEGSVSPRAATPTFDPEGATYTSVQTVTITSETEGATIYYTKNGDDPDPTTSESIPNGGTVTIDQSCTLKAIASKTGYNDSYIASDDYTIILPSTVPFVETFDETDGTGGNDGSWSGNIATSTIKYDNEGWSVTSNWGGKACIRLGTGSTFGTITSPTIKGLTIGETYTLTFKAAPWSAESTIMNVTASGATVSGLPTTAMSTQQWNDFTLTLTATATTTTLTFSANNNRFFLDEVNVTAPSTTVADGYYLVGVNGNWTPSNSYKFTSKTDGTYTLDVESLPANTEFKIVKVENGTITWYGGQSTDYFGITSSVHNNVDMSGTANYTIEGAGDYFFTISSDMKLTVQKAPIVIKGTFDWTNGVEMTKTDDGWTVSLDDTFAVGDEFGFTDGWGGWHGGAGAWVLEDYLGTALDMGTDGNYVVRVEGKYTISVNRALNKMTAILTPVAHAITCSVVTDPVDKTGGTLVADKETAVAGELVTLTINTENGYTLNSVTVNGETITPVNNVYSFEMPNADANVVANFSANTYAITVVSPNGTTTCPSSATTGQNVSFTVTPNENYTVSSVTASANTGSSTFAVPVTEENGTYKFGMPPFPVTVTVTYTQQSSGGDGEWTLVTDASTQLKAGNEYIIVSRTAVLNDENNNPYTTNVALKINNESGATNQESTENIILSADNNTATAGEDVAIFTLEGTAGAWKLRNGNNYLFTNTTTSNKLLFGTPSETNDVSDAETTITLGNNSVAQILFNNYPTGSGNNASNPRYIKQYNSNVSGVRSAVFSTYATNQQPVYLYYRETGAVATPVISPASKVFYEEFDATITCATQGATIYYTTDGTDPSVNNGTPYSTPVHISKTTTLKAIAVKDGESSGIATAEYQCTMVENIAEYNALPAGTTGIVFKNPVVVQYHYISSSGKSYIYVKDDTGCAYFHQPADGAAITQLENGDIIGAGFYGDKTEDEMVSSGPSNFYMLTNLTNFAKNGLKGLAEPELHTVAEIADATTGVELNNHYVTIKKVKLSALYQPTGITYGGAKYFDIDNVAHIGYNKFNIDWSVVDDLDAYYNITGIQTAYNNVMEFHPTEVVKWAEKEVTLRDLCDEGEVNESYTITNNLIGVKAIGTSLWVKDENGQSIHMTAPAAGDHNYEIGEEAGNKQLDQSLYDQSNWLEIVFPTAAAAQSFETTVIKGYTIKGVFDNKTNPKLTLASDAELVKYGDSDTYSPNYYCAANFYGSQDCASGEGHGHFFFMNPKPQEFAHIAWAYYQGSNVMIIPPQGNSHKFGGQFTIDLSLNSTQIPPTIGKAYNFDAIIRMVEPTRAEGVGNSNNYKVYPINLTDDVITAVTDVAGKAVAGVKYYNLAGMESDKPFEGVNIIVTTYTDGSRSSAKVLK